MPLVNDEYIVKILQTAFVTHNVKCFKVEKPGGYLFKPGQATDVCINLPDWKVHKRPFTFTGLNEWNHLEFIIKIYDDHPGVTKRLGSLDTGDELIVHPAFGTIDYYGEGYFIAGGSGVTPFIAILRQLREQSLLGDNMLLFSNKMLKDIILKDELTAMLGARFINTLTDEKTPNFDHQIIDKGYLQHKTINFSRYFYLCGPDAMVKSIHQHLLDLGATERRIIVEQF